jgi:predicted restriction endonuclease
MNKCSYCNKDFTPSRPIQKFCSAYCCNRSWYLNHKAWVSSYNKRRRLATALWCKECGEEITQRRRSGVKYCSSSCYLQARRSRDATFRKDIHEQFMHYKEALGCSCCGYNECGACLDFHHTKDKSFRIDARRWFFMSKDTRKELDKCLLLCKNCHYQLHFNKPKE